MHAQWISNGLPPLVSNGLRHCGVIVKAWVEVNDRQSRALPRSIDSERVGNSWFAHGLDIASCGYRSKALVASTVGFAGPTAARDCRQGKTSRARLAARAN